MDRLLRTNKGTTLVEILVVMLILLVGIMTVVQMFPSGFRVVKAAENQTIATKLAQAEIERWKNMPSNLPDGILPVDVTNTVINDQNPGPPFDGYMPTGTSGQFYPGNSGNFRWVRNETTSIPVGSYFQTGGGAIYGARYDLAFSPIEVDGPDPNTELYSGLSVKSGDLQRRVGDWTDSIWLRTGQYGIDYTVTTSGSAAVMHVCFSHDRDTSHVYYLSYSYTVSRTSPDDTQYLSTVDQAINPSPDGSWVEVPISVPAGYSVEEVDDGSDSCARGFVQVLNNWSSDPYEFTLADSILGIIAFNPRAHTALERTVRGVRAITARIDYRIYDPRIIREEKVMPAANEDADDDGANDHIAIKLALRGILDSGDPAKMDDGDATDNADEPTFEGLVKTKLGHVIDKDYPVAVRQPMLIIDLATGLRVKMEPNCIDFQQGIVRLTQDADLIDWASQPIVNVPLKGRHLRFFYRADGDWSVQCQKSYSFFVREWGANPVDYWHFKHLFGPPDYLLFARCMSGQSVTVDYTYADANGLHKVVGKNLRISDDVINDPTTGTKNCYVTLDVPPNAGLVANERIIVVGTTFRARVIWRDGKAWRFVDMDTNLTRRSK